MKEYQIREIFAVDYNSLEMSEKRMIWYFSIQRATLEIIEKPSGFNLSDILGVVKMQTEEEYNYAKVLTMAKVEIPSFKQVYFGCNYKLPITIQVIGLNGELYGITAKAWNPQELKFNGSVFLVPSNPIDLSGELPKKPSKKPLSVEGYKAKFLLIKILEMGGYDALIESLVKHKQGSLPAIKALNLTSRFNTQVAPLEHYVDLADVVRGSKFKVIFQKAE